MRKLNMTRSWVWQIIGAGTIWFWFIILMLLASLCSCSDEHEIVEPQMLRYEVTGNSYYAVVKDKDAPSAPYMLKGYREIKDKWETPALIGDSIEIMVMSGGVPWRPEHASVKVWLGNELIAEGSTEETGYFSVRGRLGYEYFIEKVKK
jgi:hypothetical protein